MQAKETEPGGRAEGQQEAFLKILANRSMLKAYILAIVRDPHLAEDTLSDATLAIVRAWAKYDAARPFEPWARGIARRVALANLRKRGRQPIPLDEDVLEYLGAELSKASDESDQDELKRQLRKCVDRLPERNRELVRMRYFKERSYPDIAAYTGRTPSALYMAFSRIHRALADCVRAAR